MNVADIMTPSPSSLPSTATLREASSLMATRHVRHVPVVDDGRVVGVVSDRDLLTATDGKDANASRELVDLMHVSPVVVQREDTLVMASVELGIGRIGCLPVIDDDQSLVGIITETDLMREFADASETGRLGAGGRTAVAHVMTRQPETIGPSTLLAEAIVRARRHGFRHLPVVDGGELVGIVSDRDLCREIGRGSEPDLPVADFMTREVLTLRPDDTLARAARMLVEHKISSLPVLEDGALVGILSSSDVVDRCLDALGLD